MIGMKRYCKSTAWGKSLGWLVFFYPLSEITDLIMARILIHCQKSLNVVSLYSKSAENTFSQLMPFVLLLMLLEICCITMTIYSFYYVLHSFCSKQILYYSTS